MEFEKLILNNLCNNNDYCQKVLAHLKQEYFESYSEKEIFNYVKNYVDEFKALPTKSILKHEISKSTIYNDNQFEMINSCVNEIFEINEKQNIDWLVKETEKYAQDVSFSNAVIKCFELHQNKKNKDKALEIMKDALRVEFDSNCGIDFFDEKSIEKRLEKYNEESIVIKTGNEIFDAACGGLKKKAVTVLMGGSGSGKTADMISLITGALKNGYSVAYFSLEMDEEEISKRAEANLLNIKINDIKKLELSRFKNELYKLKEQSYGKLMIKELPTGEGNVADMDRTLDNWQIKNNFKADIIVADYLSIMSSVRVKDSSSYLVLKAIVEEFRGLNIRRDAAGLTGMQVNRDGMASSKLDYTKISDSIGVVFTADLLIGIISTEEMRNNNYQVFQILKNRVNGIVDYFFPMNTEFEYSRITDASDKIMQNEIFLNNNPEMIDRVEKNKIENRKNTYNEKKMDDDFLNKSMKKSNVKNNNFSLTFDEDDDFEVF